MTSPVIDADIVDLFGDAVATAVSAAAADARGTVIPIRKGFRKLKFQFIDTAGRLAVGPAIKDVFFYDASAALGVRWKNLLDENKAILFADPTTGTGTVLDSWAVADFFYIRANDKFGGVRLEFASANDNVSTLTAAYSKSDQTFAATAITDGTLSVADTMKVETGEIIIDTVPADWHQTTLPLINSTGAAEPDVPGQKGYWFRLDVSGVLDSDFEIDYISVMTEDFGEGVTAGRSGYFNVTTEYSIDLSDGQVGNIEVGVQTSTAKTMHLTWLRYGQR